MDHSTIEVRRTVVEISEWVRDSCSKPGFADMHIDRFDPKWRDQSRWLEGGIHVLEEAIAACSSTDCNCKTAMVYTLQPGAGAGGVDFATGEDIRNLLDHSPPSVFVAEAGSEPWVTSQTHASVRAMSVPKDVMSRIFPTHVEWDGLLMQYQPVEAEEPSRTLWLLP